MQKQNPNDFVLCKPIAIFFRTFFAFRLYRKGKWTEQKIKIGNLIQCCSTWSGLWNVQLLLFDCKCHIIPLSLLAVLLSSDREKNVSCHFFFFFYIYIPICASFLYFVFNFEIFFRIQNHFFPLYRRQTFFFS